MRHMFSYLLAPLEARTRPSVLNFMFDSRIVLIISPGFGADLVICYDATIESRTSDAVVGWCTIEIHFGAWWIGLMWQRDKTIHFR